MRIFAKSLACLCVVSLLTAPAQASVVIIDFSYTNLDGAYNDGTDVFTATGTNLTTGDVNRVVAPTGEAHFLAGSLLNQLIFSMDITNVTGFAVNDTADGEGTFTLTDLDGGAVITGGLKGTWTLNAKQNVGGGNFITAYTFFGLLFNVNINDDNTTFDGDTGSWSTNFSGIASEPYHGFFVTLAVNFDDVGAGWFEEGTYDNAITNTSGKIIPAPGAVLLGMLGMGMVAAWRRKRAV